MSDGKERTTATAYPNADQYEEWKDRAEEMGMSVSEFIESMTEAGWKKFDATVDPDESQQELRKQRNDLRKELDRSRERIESLETALYNTERTEIKSWVADNPGVTHKEIVNHLMEDVGERAKIHLDDLEGIELEVRDGRWYAKEDDDE